MNEKYIFIGIDPHKEKHMAVIINKYDVIQSKIEISNNMKSFDKLIEFVDGQRDNLIPIYGIENAYGYGRSLSIYLNQKGYIVKDVNPSYANSFRNNSPTTKKNDIHDALCVANILYLKHEHLHNTNHNETYHVLSQLVRRRETIVVALTTLKNLLHDQLLMSYPEYKKMFSRIDGDTALFFWDKYQTMKEISGVNKDELAEELRKASHNSCSTRKAKQIMNIIESQEDHREYEDYNAFIIKGLVADIRYKNQELEEMKSRIKVILDVLGFKLESMPGIDTIMAGKILAEIDDINRFSNANKLTRYAGIAPVNFSLGGKGKDRKSNQGNRRLNQIIYFLALQMIQVSKGSKIPRNDSFYQYYIKKTQVDGKTNKEAITCIQRRLIGVIYGMLKYKTEYNPNIANKSVA